MEEKKFREHKSRHRDAVFLFRNGDYYEAYYEDVNVLVTVLGLDNVADCARFPFHALDTYLHKLIRAGHRVAICE